MQSPMHCDRRAASKLYIVKELCTHLSASTLSCKPVVVYGRPVTFVSENSVWPVAVLNLHLEQ
jgi:hypothetical protein